MTVSPAIARVLPFAAYIIFVVAESIVSPAGGAASGATPTSFWLYSAQILTVGALLFVFRHSYVELKASFLSGRSILIGVFVGLLVYALWRALDQPWARLGDGRPVQSAASILSSDPLFAFIRIAGVAIVVPIMEELFWRSFIMRWIEQRDFMALAPAAVGIQGLAISSLLFGLEHHLIVAGIVAGFIYGALYRRTGNLWIVIVAHAVTNAVLEFWG